MSIKHLLPATTTKGKKRLGRGYGSGKGGHTSSRGQKGQWSRRGAKVPLYFEGGNLPLIKRLPMQRGKGRLNVVRPTLELTLNDLQALDATLITLDTVRLAGLLPVGVKKVKIIATGSISKSVTVEGISASAAARKAIEAAGGELK